MTTWTPAPPLSGVTGGSRERHAQFDTPTATFTAASSNRRPDAIAFDYRTAFAYGPVANGDGTAGPTVHAWRAHDTGTDVRLARETDARDAWMPDALLFAYTGSSIEELDLAFEQAGRPVVCAERAGHVWLYWYNSLTAHFEFTDFGPGRTPRVVLDNLHAMTASDVLLFYFSDVRGFLCYRAQRDRYAVEYVTPVLASADRFVEDVAVSTDNRVHCYYSERDPATGRYALHVLESTLYPLPQTPDTLTTGIIPLSDWRLVSIILEQTLSDVDTVAAGLTLTSAWALGIPLIAYRVHDQDLYTATFAIRAGWTLETIQQIISHILGDLDQYTATVNLLPGWTNLDVIVSLPLYDSDEYRATFALQSGWTLVTI